MRKTTDMQLSYHSDGIPIVEVVPEGKTQVKFYCPYCKCWHYHGWVINPEVEPTDPDYLGHRVSHCHVSDSPLNRLGYYLIFGEDKK